jgi:hypothetical protein
MELLAISHILIGGVGHRSPKNEGTFHEAIFDFGCGCSIGLRLSGLRPGQT